MVEKKIMYGFDNIHISKITKNGYSVPINLEGAKSINVELNYETEIAKAGNRNIRFTRFAGGEGVLSVVGLSGDEYELLFGHAVTGTRVDIKESDIAPKLALMFSRKNTEGKNIGYCIYSVVCKPIDLSATTMENGAMTEESIQIEFDIESRNGNIYYFDECDSTFFYEVR